MEVHAPSPPVLGAAVVLLILALVGYFEPTVPFVSQYQFWIAVAAAVILVLDCVVAPSSRQT